MPNPKDYMDDNHQYVKGYVRRKPGTSDSTEKNIHISFLWFVIVPSCIAVIVALVTKSLAPLAAIPGLILFRLFFFVE